MTLTDILKLVDAASTAFAAVLVLAQETRATLSGSDQIALDEHLKALQALNDRDFARLDQILAGAETG